MATRFAVTTGNWNGAIWAATAGGSAGSAAVPTSADDVTINAGVTVTLDATGCICRTLTANGTLKNNAAANTDFTAQRAVTFNSGSTIDIDGRGDVTKSCTLKFNGDGTSPYYHMRFVAGVTALRLRGYARTRWCRATSAMTANSTKSASFSDVTGWQVGDKILIGTTQTFTNTAKHDWVTIATITPGSGTTGTVTWTDGAGTGGAVLYAHAANAYAGNFSSNVTLTSAVTTNATTFARGLEVNFSNTEVSQSKTITNVLFSKLGPSAYFYPTLQILCNAQAAGKTVFEAVSDNAFLDGATYVVYLGNYVSPSATIPIDRNIFYTRYTSFWPNDITLSDAVLDNAPTGNVHFGSDVAGTNTRYGLNNISGIATFTDSVFMALAAGMVGSSNNGGLTFVNPSFVANNNAITANTWGLTYINSGKLGTEFAAENAYGMDLRNSGFIYASDLAIQPNNIFNSNYLQLYGGPQAGIQIRNRDSDAEKQERYMRSGNLFRDSTLAKNSDSSMKFRQMVANEDQYYSYEVLVAPGASLALKGHTRKDTSTTSIVIAADINGTPVDSFTHSAAVNTWEAFTLTLSHAFPIPTLIRVRYTIKDTASTSALAYVSGIPEYPFVNKVRWYGYQFDETVKTRTVNPAIVQATEATAYAYTGFTIAGGASVSPITVTADNTIQKMYDHTQAWSCNSVTNINYAVPLVATGPGNFNANANITVSTTKVLNGAGSINMGAFTLTTEFAGGYGYSFTGGTWAQGSTVPSFTGGTVSMPSEGFYTFSANDSTLNFAPTTDGAEYDLSGCTLTGTITVTNTSGHTMDLVVPAGVTISNATTGANEITVLAPTVERGLEFTGLVAGSQVVVCETGTQDELFRDNASSTSEKWSEAVSGSLTVDYTVMKAGYLPIRVTGVVVTGAISGGVQAVPVQQVADRAYTASSGLTWGSTATVNAGTKAVTLSAASTVQNWYSFMIESWIAQSALVNTRFPFSANGPNSFTLGNGWVWGDGATSIAYLSRDGMRYVDASGNVTAMWAALLSVGVPSGMQVRFQQVDGSGTTSAATTGNIDQLIQILSDPNGDGSFGDGYDKRGHLVLKVQAEGYDEAEFDAVATYGALEDQFYVAGLSPTANGIAAGGTYTGLTLTDHGASPVTWNSKDFSLTITDTTNARSGTEILQWIRNTNAFNYGDLVRTNGDKFKTVRGAVYGDVGATLKGVRVVKADGTTPHNDFNLFTADDGTTYTPPVAAPISWAGAVDGTTVLLFNDSDGGALIDTQIISGSGGYLLDITLPDASVAAGDTLRLRYGHIENYAGELTAAMGANGLTFLGTQQVHPVYATWGIDGTTCTEFEADEININVDITGVSGSTSKKRLGAFTQYLMTLPAGLAAFYGAFTLEAPNSIRQNASVVDVLIHNTSGVAFAFTDVDVRYYRDDYALPYDITGDAIFMDFEGVPFVVTTSDQAVNEATVLAALTTQGFTTARAPKLDNLDVAVSTRLPTSGYTTPPTAAAVRAEIDANSTKLDVAVGTRLADADYVEPDNAGIAAIPTTPVLVDDPRLDTLVPTLSKVTDMHELEGLDASKPLVVTATSRVAGTIEQTITDSAGTVTVERQ